MSKRSAPTRRLALTLPASTAADLAYVSLRFGVRKSDLVADLLALPLAQMRAALWDTPSPLDRLSAEDKAALEARFGTLVAETIASASAELGVSHE